MTDGPLLRVLLSVALPITISNLVMSTYDIVNAFWVGRLGESAIAAVAASGPLLTLLVSLGSGLSTAGAVLIAQNAGAGRTDMLDHVAAQTLLMVVCVALGFTLIGSLVVWPVLGWIGVHSSIASLAHSYLQLRLLALAPMFLFLAMQAMQQAVGEVRFAMNVQIGSVIANAALDPLLIFGLGPIPGMGVRGAATATAIVQVASVILLLLRLLSGRSALHLRKHHFRPDWSLIRVAVGLGLPASIEQAIRTFSSVLLMSLAASFGTLGLATYGVGSRPLFFWFTPMVGLSIATAAVVGQNIGAGLFDRAAQAGRYAAWLAFLGMGVIGLAHLPFLPAIMHSLAPTEPDIAASAITFGYICFPFLGFLAVPQALLGAFRGAGSPRHSMTISIAMQWAFQLPAAFLLARFTSLGLLGIWWSYPFANIAATLLCLYWFRHGSWRRRLAS